MRWRKLGIVVPPPIELPWVASHAAVPHVEPVSDGVFRIYFTTRDAQQRSHIASALMALGDDGLVSSVDVDPTPMLRPGERGTFDDHGTMTSCIVRHGDEKWLYYQGWSLGVTVPFSVFVGCARRLEGDSEFTRVSLAPVLDRSPTDPWMCASPWVIVEGDLWRMWYVSNRGWTERKDGKLEYRVHVRYAESSDGITWRRDGRVCIDFAGEAEHAISRPVVVRDSDCYRMWYSRRGDAYRIGYAESDDGYDWTRMDDRVGIDVSSSGWDSEMVEYACVFDHAGRRHMLYNGNGFGRTGIGHAVLEPD